MTEMPNMNNVAPKSILSQRFSNRVTLALWIVALSSHAILLPKFLRDFSEKKR